jgi:nitrous oxidase accessory protein
VNHLSASGALLAGLLACLPVGIQAGDTLQVGPDAAYRRLADAVQASRKGDLIRVGPGRYAEKGIVIRHALTLEGLGSPVLDAQGGGTILDIRADGVEVRGFAFRDVGVDYLKEHGAIWITDAADARILDNRFEKVFFGVYGAHARRATVRGNSFEGLWGKETANGNGLHFWKSDSIRIEGNSIRGHRDGIYLEFTGNSQVIGNTCEGNVRYGLHFMYANGNSYVGNVFRSNGSGVAVMYSRDVDMRGNRFERNWGAASYGVLLKSITGSRIEDNVFEKNTVAIFLEASSRIRLTGNSFRRNGWALRIVSDCDANTFAGNSFSGNTFDVAYNASPASTNVFEGNTWDHYQGWDLDRDGIGDIPHRPVELFPTVMQDHPQAMVLLRSHFVTLLNVIERMFPTLSPPGLQDMRPVAAAAGTRGKAP